MCTPEPQQGFHRTLAALDEEAPRTSDTVSKRSELARLLGLEKHILKSKEAGNGRDGMLEVMAG